MDVPGGRLSSDSSSSGSLPGAAAAAPAGEKQTSPAQTVTKMSSGAPQPMMIDVERILEGYQTIGTSRYKTEAEKALEKAWRSVSIAPRVNTELVSAAASRFKFLEPALKLRLLVSLLSLTPMQRHSLNEESMEALLQEAKTDCDEWVRVVAMIVSPIRSKARIDASPENPKMKDVLAETEKAIKSNGGSRESLITCPLEWAYLNNSLQQANSDYVAPEIGPDGNVILPPLPEPSHSLFHVKKRPSPLEKLIQKKQAPALTRPRPEYSPLTHETSSDSQTVEHYDQEPSDDSESDDNVSGDDYDDDYDDDDDDDDDDSDGPFHFSDSDKKRKSGSARGRMIFMGVDEMEEIKRLQEKEKSEEKKAEEPPPAKRSRKGESSEKKISKKESEKEATPAPPPEPKKTKEELRAERKAKKKAEKKAARKAAREAAAAARKAEQAEAKSKEPSTPTTVTTADGQVVPVKRGKGRPRKSAAVAVVPQSDLAVLTSTATKGESKPGEEVNSPSKPGKNALSKLPSVITPRAVSQSQPPQNMGVSVHPPSASAAEYNAYAQALVHQALRQYQQPQSTPVVTNSPKQTPAETNPAAGVSLLHSLVDVAKSASEGEQPSQPATAPPPQPSVAPPPQQQPPPAVAAKTEAEIAQQRKDESIAKATAVMEQLQQQPCNCLTEAKRKVIWQFLMGSREHTGDSPVVSILIHSETKKLPDGTTGTESIVFEMNYDTMTWKKIRKRLKQ